MKKYNPGSLSAIDYITQEYSKAIADRSVHLRDADKKAGQERSQKYKAAAASASSGGTKQNTNANKAASK